MLVMPEKHQSMPTNAAAEGGFSVNPWVIADEVTHRVVNEYSLAISSLSLAAAKTTNQDARATILKATERLREFAGVHRALQAPVYSSLVDLAEYLRGICTAMTRAVLEERGVRLTLIEQPVILTARHCWCIGMIVSELIVNAMRHGFDGGSGSIVVGLHVTDGKLVCWVSDNGRPPTDPRSGRGSAIITNLTRLMGGQFERRFSDAGTTALLCFPHGPAGAMSD